MPDNRELPEGARQSKVNGELASEQPAEGLARFIREISEKVFWQTDCVGLDGTSAV